MSTAKPTTATATRPLPDFEQATASMARVLGMSTDEMHANFRRALPSDLTRVIELRRRALGDGIHWDDAAYLTWRYRFGSDDRGRGDCWLVERGSELLGILGTEEVELNGASGPCRAIFLMDLLVREDIRELPLASWMNMAILERYDCVALLVTNGVASSVVEQFPERRIVRTYYYSVRCDTAVRRRLDVPLISSLMAGIGNTALRAWRKLRLYNNASIRVKDVVHLAELASLLTERYGKGVIGRERTANFLEWRAADNPRATFRMLVARRDHVPTAYLVVRETEQELCLVDWFYAPTDKGASLRAVVRTAIALAAKNRRQRVTTSLLDARSATVLKRMGFSTHSRDDHAFLYSVRPTHPIGKLSDFQWYLTPLDGNGD